jgi:hypothetical protein
MISARVTAALASALFLISGCGASSSGTTAPSENEEPAAPAQSADRPTDAELAAFTKAFTRKYPDLAHGRSKASIGDDADNTCLDLRQGTERAVIVKYVQGRFARDTTPSAKTAAGIITLIRSKACPDD